MRPRQLSVPALVVALFAGGALVACSSGPDAGDCVERSGDSYETTDCATASLRVLERVEHSPDDCIDVPGVTETYFGSDVSGVLCIGPRDVDPDSAINVVQDGDCLTGVAANSNVRRVDCADPAAESVVLRRIEYGSTGHGTDECASVPGVSASYRWDLDSTGDASYASERLISDLLFCLGPVGVDPNASPDTAQAGDCLAETPGNPGFTKVACNAPDAAFQVVEREDGWLATVETACATADGATFGIDRHQGDFDGYVLCLAPN